MFFLLQVIIQIAIVLFGLIFDHQFLLEVVAAHLTAAGSWSRDIAAVNDGENVVKGFLARRFASGLCQSTFVFAGWISYVRGIVRNWIRISLLDGWSVLLYGSDLRRLKHEQPLRPFAIALVGVIVQVRLIYLMVCFRGSVFILRGEWYVHDPAQCLALKQFLGLLYLTLRGLSTALQALPQSHCTAW